LYINEIVLCTMKSSQARMKSSAFASDEIKSAAPIPTKSDFIAKRFHPTQVGFLPPSADLVEKSTHCLGRQMCAFFCERATKRIQNTNGFILQNRFTFFGKWVHFFLENGFTFFAKNGFKFNEWVHFYSLQTIKITKITIFVCLYF